MCVLKIKAIHARVTEFCSGNENADAGRRDGHPRRRHYLTPPLRWAGDKKSIAHPNVARNVMLKSRKKLTEQIF